MELVLNLAWMVLTVLMFWLWLHRAAREDADRWTQLAALAAAILILFPAISVTDDLAMAQNPAVTDSFQRKGQLRAIAHSAHHPAADMPPLFTTAPLLDLSRSVVPGNLLAPVLKAPAIDSIQSRPPPASQSIHRRC
jgi:hypothetical protein